MRRAALCLLSTIALAAALPASAEDASPERTPAVVDPAALTPKTRAEGDANVAPATSPGPASNPIETSSIPEAKPSSQGAPASSEPPAAPASQDTAAPSSAPESTPAPASPAPQAPQQATPDPAPQAPPAVAVPVEPPPPALNTALLAAVESSKPSARQSQEREWHEAISTFYAARKGQPVWVTDSGLGTNADALVAEMGRADEWGLDPKAFDVKGLPSGGATPEALAAAELKLTNALLTYAWHARGGRLDPSQLSKWLDQSPRPLDVKALLEQFATTSDPSLALQKLHPQHRQFELLRQAYLKARGAKEQAEDEDPREVTIPDGRVVRLGDRHEHVELVRRRLEVPARSDADADLYDEDVAAAVREFLGATFRTRDGRTVRRAAHPDLTNYVRSRLSQKKQEAKSSKPTLKQYLVNLERWRWMPENLGTTYVWNNLPEYTTRVIRNGQVIHQERIIIGKPTNQTPIFSDEMEFVVFHPDWGVPGTIKVTDLLPALQAGDDSILERRNMRIVHGNRTVRAYEIDWERTDIRTVSIIQDPGASNPLGQLKFMFPNKHDVYMHDTPTKNLFDSKVRAYSSGCIRVRNPVRLAELVFGQDRNWTLSEINDLLKPRAQENNRVNLNRRVPVHNTYFTLLADEQGEVTSFADVYGHDKRIRSALLDGESVASVARGDPAAALERKVKSLASNPPPRRESYGSWGGWGWGPPPRGRRGYSNNDFFSGIFGN
jgi:murein L,D-transpeptidase YcbB/YkuD